MIISIKNDNGTISAIASHIGIHLAEFSVEAEYYPHEPGDMYNPPIPAQCNIERLYFELADDYEVDFDLTKLHNEVRQLEIEIIEFMRDNNV